MGRIPLATTITVPFDDQQLGSLRKPRALDRAPKSHLSVTWGEVLRGAILCGVPGWEARRRHGLLGQLEIRRRAFHLLSHLEVRPVGTTHGLYRTAVYETEDGSEKTASSYLIGMAIALATCRATGVANALLHFDGVHGASGTRPDLIASDYPNTHFVEVKGRFKTVGQPAMNSAVKQLDVHRLRAQTMYAAAIATGFRRGRLHLHRQWYRTPKPSASAVLALLREGLGDAQLRQWEPLVVALWYAGLPEAMDSVGRTVLEGGPFIFVEILELGLVVGLAAETFDRVTDRLRQADVLPYDLGVDPREADVVPAAMFEDRYVADGLLIAWTSNPEGTNI